MLRFALHALDRRHPDAAHADRWSSLCHGSRRDVWSGAAATVDKARRVRALLRWCSVCGEPHRADAWAGPAVLRCRRNRQARGSIPHHLSAEPQLRHAAPARSGKRASGPHGQRVSRNGHSRIGREFPVHGRFSAASAFCRMPTAKSSTSRTITRAGTAPS